LIQLLLAPLWYAPGLPFFVNTPFSISPAPCLVRPWLGSRMNGGQSQLFRQYLGSPTVLDPSSIINKNNKILQHFLFKMF
jgi:hypothetical protein